MVLDYDVISYQNPQLRTFTHKLLFHLKRMTTVYNRQVYKRDRTFEGTPVGFENWGIRCRNLTSVFEFRKFRRS